MTRTDSTMDSVRRTARWYWPVIRLAATLALGVAAVLSSAVPPASAGLAPQAGTLAAPPKTPPGLAVCQTALVPDPSFSGSQGERIQYAVELIGLQVGTVNVAAKRRGTFQGQPATEYRAWVEPDPMVGALVRLEGRLAAVVPDGAFVPATAMIEYRFRSDNYAERQTFSAGGAVLSQRAKNGRRKTYRHNFQGPVLDFLTAFNAVRHLPPGSGGCLVLVNDGRAFTLWLEHKGLDKVTVADRSVTADRYLVRYGHDRSKKIIRIELWVGRDPRRLPYKGKALTRFSPVLTLSRYRPGRSS